jgi:hypothetical protein
VYEALLHGVIVVTLPMDVFVELYGDAVYYIPFDHKYLNQDDKIPHPELSQYISNEFVKAIQILEASPSLQQEYITKGRQLLTKFNQESCVRQLFSHLHIPYQSITYQYLFLVSSNTTEWNGHVNPPSCFQTIITIAEQLSNVVICCIDNKISPIYHNNVLYVNYYALPKTYYNSVVVSQFIPIDFINHIQYSTLRVSEPLVSLYQNEKPVAYQSLNEFLPILTTKSFLANTLSQNKQSQDISLVFPSRISTKKILLILHSQTSYQIQQIYQLYPSHEIHVHVLERSDLYRYKGVHYCDEISSRQYDFCILDYYSPQGLEKYSSSLFGLLLYIITCDEKWSSIVQEHPYIKFLIT